MPRYILRKNKQGKTQVYDRLEKRWSNKLISDLNRLNQKKEPKRKA